MILCPLAAVAGCNSCPVNKICLAKGILGTNKDQSEMPELDDGNDVSNSSDKINKS